jgi:hypothetical protein
MANENAIWLKKFCYISGSTNLDYLTKHLLKWLKSLVPFSQIGQPNLDIRVSPERVLKLISLVCIPW